MLAWCMETIDNGIQWLKKAIWRTETYTVLTVVKKKTKFTQAQYRYSYKTGGNDELAGYKDVKLRTLELHCEHDVRLEVDHWSPFHSYLQKNNACKIILVKQLFGLPFLIRYGENKEYFYLCNMMFFTLMFTLTVAAIGRLLIGRRKYQALSDGMIGIK